ncbi:MAG: hypothetical protein ABW110_03615, partial [Steroidobacteraceae bacterium]
MQRMIRSAFLVLLSVLLVPMARADDRSLYWASMDVKTQLDADGRLRVRETQAMVFDGAWNGGERRFRVGRGQELKFIGLYEIDSATGERRAFNEGSLDSIGEYRWFDGDVLRWRARLPSDAPFAHALRVYELEYELANIIERVGTTYVLDHDFAFPERDGPIVEFTATLELDPAWQPAQSFEANMVRTQLPPGQGVVQRITLNYVGSGSPGSVNDSNTGINAPASRSLVLVLLGTLAALVTIYVLRVTRRERERGRFDSSVQPEDITAEWLNDHLFKYAPEVVGGAWDRETSTHEVAAVLARMTLEKKLSSEVTESGWWIFRGSVLHLKELVPRESLPAFERKLVAALFFDGPTTDTDRIRRHYSSSGFSPDRYINPQVERSVQRLLGKPEKLSPLHWILTLLAVVSGVAACLFGALRAETAPLVVVLLGALLICWVFAKSRARAYRNQSLDLARHALGVLACVTILLVLLGWVLLKQPFESSVLQCMGFTLLGAGLLNSVHNALLCRETATAVALRRQFASARRFFQ